MLLHATAPAGRGIAVSGGTPAVLPSTLPVFSGVTFVGQKAAAASRTASSTFPRTSPMTIRNPCSVATAS